MGRRSIHLQLIDPDAQGAGAVFTFGGQTRLVDGKYKALGLWLLTFMTAKGSDPLDAAAGTEFPLLLGSNLSDPEELEGVLHTYVDDATEQVRAIQAKTPYLTLDERVRNAVVTQFKVLSPGRFEIWVELQVESGARVSTLIPYAAG